MIRRLRWKVVGITMLFVTLVLVGAFAAILLTARNSLEANAQQQLTKVLRSGGSDWLTPNGQGSAFPCFLVEVYSGGVVRMTGSAYYQIDEAALTAIVEACLAQQDESGVLEEFGLRYVRQSGAYAVRIAFTHISFERSTLYTLLKTCLAIGGGAAVIFFVCSYLLSGLITAPVERAWKEERRFLSDASHELKTPLTVILSSADLLAPSAQGEQRGYVDNIQAEGQRMRSLVEDMLTLARTENGAQKAAFTRVDLSDLVMDAALRFEPVAYEAGRELTYQVEPELSLWGDPAQLRQLPGILLDNAIKYGDACQPVRMSLTRQEKNAVLTVENSGPAIPAERLPHLFDRFYRADESRSDHGSFGLGLPIARAIAQAHGGSIRCQSDETVTRFVVTLPIKHGKEEKKDAGKDHSRGA